MDKRRLNSEQIVALACVNCCGNSLENNLPIMARIAGKDAAEKLRQALETVRCVVDEVVAAEEDPDRAEGIRRRMDGLVVNVSHVPKAPLGKFLISLNDLDMLVAAMLEKCEMDCPCVYYGEDGSRTVDKVAVKRCETAKMFKRLLLGESGLSGECMYKGLL